MRYVFLPLTAALLFVFCSGCSTLQRTAAVSETGVAALDSLNQMLEDLETTIILVDGDEIPARSVRLGMEETRYEARPAGRNERVPTDEIARIIFIEEAGGSGHLVGVLLAVPGLVIMGISAAEWIVSDRGSYGRTFAPLFLVAGAGVAAAGAILGSIIGDALVPKERRTERVVYEGPVERYLKDDMPP